MSDRNSMRFVFTQFTDVEGEDFELDLTLTAPATMTQQAFVRGFRRLIRLVVTDPSIRAEIGRGLL